MNRIIVLIITFSVWFHVFAQLEIGKGYEQPVIPTWESYECIKYGTIGASLYTGTVNYSIPVYTYKDKDFEIPISLEYATNGLRVNHSSGLLGHGWSLSCLGRITRKIKGIPDDVNITSQYIVPIDMPNNLFIWRNLELYGYNGLNVNTQYAVAPLYRTNNDQVTISYMNTSTNQFYEYEPDEFSFDFCGYSGSFHLTRLSENGDLQCVIYDGSGESRGLKIRFISDLNANNGSFDTIEIRDNKGYIYTFERIEFFRKNTFEIGEPVHPQLTDITLSWGIASIKAPNGRLMKFSYSSKHDLESTSQEPVQPDDKIYNPLMSYYFSTIDGVEFPPRSTPEVYHCEDIYKLVIDSINFADGTRAIFSKSDGNDEIMIAGLTPGIAHTDIRRLKNIEIISNNKTITLCKLGYDITENDSANSNRVTFLTNVDVSGIGRYTFEYNNQNGRYPYLGTGEYDHWGYYNGEGQGFPLTCFYNMNNILDYDAWGNETLLQPIKEPSFTNALSGTLCRISYPTGGFSTIEYEPHKYSRDVIRTSNSEGDRTHYPFFQPTLRNLTNDEIAGGVRLKQIITHLSDTIINDTITFDYTLSDHTGLSSGILTMPSRYGMKYDTPDGRKHVEYYNLSNSMYDYSRTHIEYSHIKKTRSGQGSVTYDYSTSANEIDREFGEFEPDFPYGNESRVPLLAWVNGDKRDIACCSKPIEMALTPMASFQTKRGKLLKEAFYNNNNELIQEIVNNYSFPLVRVDTMWQVVGEVAKKTYAPRFNVELTSTTTNNYSRGILISKTENYTYNDLGLTTSVTTNTSDGSLLRTNLYYVCDSMSNSGVIADMAESHNLAQLLKKEQYKVSNGIEKLVSAERIEYYHPNSNNLSLACPIAKYSWLNGQQWKLVESYQYDDKGNLVELTDTRGIRESFLWGYKGRYPVARVNNSSFDDLNHLLNNSANTIRDMATLSDNKFIELKNLGIRTQQWNSLYSLYRYRPGVGLTEAVAPNLSTTTYQYNGYGKLTEIRDNGGHLIEQYDYKIVTVEPLSASLVCDASCYKNNELKASVKCNGGSGVYSYNWAIVKANGDTVNVLDNDTTITISPMVLNLLSGQNCTIECTVHDMVSGETLTSDQTVYVKPAILRFENIVESVNPSNSSAIITASIYCDNNVSAQFCFERICTGQCSVSVGNSSYSNFVNKTTYFYMALHPGWNNVTLTVTNAEIADVELSIVSAEGHDIGVPSSISAQI